MNKLSNQQIKLDERDHVELPLLDQLKDLGLAVPFIVGAPQLQGDALAGFGPKPMPRWIRWAAWRSSAGCVLACWLF